MYFGSGVHSFTAIERDKLDFKVLFQAFDSFTQRPVKMHEKEVNNVTTPDKKKVSGELQWTPNALSMF